MVNTVGSLKVINKYWQKKWIEIKNSLSLTNEQRSVIVGSILGDGTLRLGERAINVNLKIEHGLAQQEYVLWKYNILRPWVFTEPKISYRYRENGERYVKSLWFRTIRHPLLTGFYELFYKNGKKIIPLDIDQYLDSLGMAVWVMDDGSLNQNKIDISTYSFIELEINLLLRVLDKKFGLNGNYYRDRDKGYRMYFNVKETEKLVEIIKPYIIDSMKYKITLKPRND
ncbi:hypothetical protein GW901_01030 [Candidatus Parcubacteria bacterium]|nr:hypothetical protein [Candidatus Parcubacteria bacterium]NCQ02491.1 hypothetical protein [Candidatus Wolfebacteria bacterium]